MMHGILNINGMRVFENSVLRKILGSQRDEVPG
jgi:hypothetical protein